MDLRTELRFDTDPVTVFAMFTDQAYLARKAEATGAVRHEASVARAGDRVTVRLLRVMPPDVPDLLRRFVGETIDLDQTDVWEPASADGSRTGSIHIDMGGAPVNLTGGMTLIGTAGGAAATVDAKVKASIPLVGGRIEKAVHDAVVHAARIEEQVGRAWLAGDRSR
ncbi:MAG: DUF2505 domain-containing protein [Jiangellaceae bacterium]